LGGRGRWIPEFEASLVYRVSSRSARATQRNPVLKNQKKKKKKVENKHMTINMTGGEHGRRFREALFNTSPQVTEESF
jgi:hypothetical protein